MAKVLYARVSTVGQNIDRQIQDADQYDMVFIDKCSGKDTNRPKLQEMLTYIREGDILEVHELSRLARNTFDLLSLVRQILDKKVDIHFLKENICIKGGQNDPVSILVMEIFASVAQFERKLVAERAREGRELCKLRGGYKGTKKRLNTAQIEELKDLAKNRDAWGIPALMKRYGISRSSVYNYLAM